MLAHTFSEGPITAVILYNLKEPEPLHLTPKPAVVVGIYIYVRAGSSLAPQLLIRRECRMQWLLECDIFYIMLTAMNSGRG